MKMGWKEGKGLGLNEDGRTDHVRAKKKTSMTGVGADGKVGGQWEAPGQMAEGLNNVLRTLKSVGNAAKEKKEEKTVVERRGYYERKRARKCVSNYSESDLREIFGGVEDDVYGKQEEEGEEKEEKQGGEECEKRLVKEMDEDERKKREKKERKRKKRKDREEKMKKGNKLKVKSKVKKMEKRQKKVKKQKSKP